MHVRIGSRGSRLALWQSHYVGKRLVQMYPETTYEIKVIKTQGDRIQDVSLQKLGDKGIFVQEIEELLLHGAIDLAVHSMKDMPAVISSDFVFSKIMEREDPRDALILKAGDSLKELKAGAIIGTGSVRRSAQLLKMRPDLVMKDIRGNVETRIRKLREEEYDGIVLAVAGLKRIGLESEITEYFDCDDMVPACAQGALAVELKKDNEQLFQMLEVLGHEETQDCVMAERLFLEEMAGNCHIPMGGYCEKVADGYIFRGMLGVTSGDKALIKSFKKKGQDPKLLAIEAVRELKN